MSEQSQPPSGMMPGVSPDDHATRGSSRRVGRRPDGRGEGGPDWLRQRLEALQDKMREHHPMWVVTGPDNPRWPGWYVAVFHYNHRPSDHSVKGATLDEIHALLPRGLTRFPPTPSDPREVTEVWL